MAVSGRTTKSDLSFLPCSIARMMLAVFACQSPLMVLIWPMVTSMFSAGLCALVFGVSLFEGSCLFQSRIANYERVVGEKFGRSVLRLCRLPCGKLRAFRTPLREIEASPG